MTDGEATTEVKANSPGAIDINKAYNPHGARKYMLKGLDTAFAALYGNYASPQGEIYGKRLGFSASLAPASARNMAPRNAGTRLSLACFLTSTQRCSPADRSPGCQSERNYRTKTVDFAAVQIVPNLRSFRTFANEEADDNRDAPVGRIIVIINY